MCLCLRAPLTVRYACAVCCAVCYDYCTQQGLAALTLRPTDFDAILSIVYVRGTFLVGCAPASAWLGHIIADHVVPEAPCRAFYKLQEVCHTLLILAVNVRACTQRVYNCETTTMIGSSAHTATLYALVCTQEAL